MIERLRHQLEPLNPSGLPSEHLLILQKEVAKSRRRALIATVTAAGISLASLIVVLTAIHQETAASVASASTLVFGMSSVLSGTYAADFKRNLSVIREELAARGQIRNDRN